MPTLVCWGVYDTRVTKQETKSIYKQLAAKKKQLVIFEESGHQSFCRKEEEKWKHHVQEFLTDRE
jgi:esterase/lipase